MGKKSRSEKKRGESPKIITMHARRCFSKIINKTNISKKSTANIKKLLKEFGSNTGASITELINSLDIKLYDINNKSTFKIDFLSHLNDRQFSILFKEGINFARRNYKIDNLRKLKKMLLLLKDINGNNNGDEFGLNSCDNKLLKIYRKDLILSLLSDEKKIEELKAINLKDLEIKFKQSIDYGLFFDNNSFSNSLPYNENSIGNYPFNDFKQILLSPVVLETYREALKELYNVQISLSEIKNIVTRILKNYPIFLLPMNLNRYGMMMYDGTIIINKAYIIGGFNFENAFMILFTLMHKLMHIISRLKRGDNNYLLNTDEFTKSKIMTVDESGFYFENKLILGLINSNQITVAEAEYLLKLKNYEYATIKDFQSAFLLWQKNHANIIKTSPKFIIRKEKEDKSFSFNTGCYCAGPRNNRK